MLRTKTTAQVMHEAAEEEAELDGVDADGKSVAGGLAKVLTVWDIIAYGIGSTLGAGIFAITASGTLAAGPAIVISFIVAAIACLFSAFSYMEFAARVPIAGSAYTFTYVSVDNRERDSQRPTKGHSSSGSMLTAVGVPFSCLLPSLLSRLVSPRLVSVVWASWRPGSSVGT